MRVSAMKNPGSILQATFLSSKPWCSKFCCSNVIHIEEPFREDGAGITKIMLI